MAQICCGLVFWDHICRIRREMVRTRAWCIQSMCMPSLYATITGANIINIGVEDEKRSRTNSHWWIIEPWREETQQQQPTEQKRSLQMQRHYTLYIKSENYIKSDTPLKLTHMYPRGNSGDGKKNSEHKIGTLMSCQRTKNDMNNKLVPAPTKMVLNAGTYHGMLAYSPVHPNQKTPTIRMGLPIIAPMSLSSGGGNPFHFLISSG